MEDLTFRLEGIVKTRDDMEDFEGPLTLILQLLSKNKIEIRDIQISLILQQYLEYLDEMKSMDLEVASEFVAMASHLVYIKTRKLLNAEETVSELDQLISSLESLRARDSYLQIKSVTGSLQEMFRRGAGTCTKPPEYFEPDKSYKYCHTAEDLFLAIRRVMDAGESYKAALNPRPFFVPERILYPVTEKTSEIIQRLKISGVMRLKAFFSESESRSELVATFIAVLELCGSGGILITGADDDLIISAVSMEALEEARTGGADSQEEPPDF